MAFSKADRFDPKDHHYALLCKAISHPARINIIRRILDAEYENKFLNAGDLSVNLPLSRTTISHHLQQLRVKKILRARYIGANVIYEVNKDLPDTFIHILYMIWNARAEPNGDIQHQIDQLYHPVADD